MVEQKFFFFFFSSFGLVLAEGSGYASEACTKAVV